MTTHNIVAISLDVAAISIGTWGTASALATRNYQTRWLWAAYTLSSIALLLEHVAR